MAEYSTKGTITATIGGTSGKGVRLTTTGTSHESTRMYKVVIEDVYGSAIQTWSGTWAASSSTETHYFPSSSTYYTSGLSYSSSYTATFYWGTSAYSYYNLCSFSTPAEPTTTYKLTCKHYKNGTLTNTDTYDIESGTYCDPSDYVRTYTGYYLSSCSQTSSWTMTAAKTISYYYMPNIYTITYNANGGSGTVPDSQTKTTGETLTLRDCTTLTKTGYALTGWNTGSGGGGTHYDLGGSYTLNVSDTLYAEWKEFTKNSTESSSAATVTFSSSTSSTITFSITWANPVDAIRHYRLYYRTGSAFTSSVPPAFSSSYSYAGTYKLASQGSSATVTLEGLSAATVYYVQLQYVSGNAGTPTYITVFWSNGLGMTESDTYEFIVHHYYYGTTTRVISDDKYTKAGGDHIYPSAYAAAIPGHEVVSYSPSSDYYIPDTLAQNIYYQKKTYTISYDNNGGSGYISPQTATYGDTITLSNGAAFSKTGYVIDYWTLDSTSGATYALNYANYPVTANHTFYAHWKPTYTYTINYYSDSSYYGQDSVGPTIATYTNLEITVSNPTKSGWTFVAWRNASDTVRYTRGDTVYLTYEAPSASLHAVWSTTYILNLDPNGGTLPSGFSGQLTHTGVESSTDSFSLSTSYNPTKSGWTFYGWGNNTTTKVYSPTGTVTFSRSDSPKTIYAIWFKTSDSLIGEVTAGSETTLNVTITATYSRNYDRYIYIKFTDQSSEEPTRYTISANTTTVSFVLSGLSSDRTYTFIANMYAYDPDGNLIKVGDTSQITGYTNLTYDWTYAYGQTTGTRKVAGREFRVTADEWNQYMNKLATKYNRRTHGSMTKTTVSDGQEFMAGYYNEASSVLQDFGAPSSAVPTVVGRSTSSNPDQIKADYLNYLINYLETDDN